MTDSTLQVENPAAAPEPMAPVVGPMPRSGWGSYALILALVLGVLALAGAVAVWQKLGRIQSQQARQTQDALATSQEAKAIAKGALETGQQSSAKMTLQEAKLNELIAQKARVDEMLETLSRSKIENLVLDIESSLILAQQQGQMTGSVQPMMVALLSAQQRLARTPSARTAPLESAIRRDMDRLRAANVLDTPALLARLDELVRAVDGLPLLAAGTTKEIVSKSAKAAASGPGAISQSVWYQPWMGKVWQQMISLVQVRRIDHPDALLLNQEQAFFVRENLKLQLLNARIAVLARQFEPAKADLMGVKSGIEQYFDVQSKSGQAALVVINQVVLQLQTGTMPGLDQSLNAVATVSGRK